jgi:TetR/AcrR family transcriptional regulator, mexCD-oprJ operon repressor
MSSPEPHQLRPRQALQQRVVDLILDGAARTFRRGGDANMSEIALEAGVARATVYRHFPSRQALLDRLAERAVRDASDRLVAARLDEVPPRDAVKRAIRALVEAGDYVTVLAGARVGSDTDGLAEAMAQPLVRMIQRGQSDGSLRPDLPPDWIADSLVGIVLAILSSPRKQGREDTVDSVVALFLDGAAFHQATPTPPEAQ